MDKLFLEIVTPEGEIFANDVKSVQVPGCDGEFGILPRHATLVTTLNAGVIEVVNLDGTKDMIAIDDGGCIKVAEDKTTILANGAVYIGGSNESEIAISLQKAKELVKSMSSNTIVYATTIAKIDEQVRQK